MGISIKKVDIKLILGPNDSRFNDTYHESKVNISDAFFISYIYNNLLFYTEIFNDYIIAFSKLNTLKNSEIIQLKDILELYKNNENHIINGLILFSSLEEISVGKIFVNIIFFNDQNSNTTSEVDNHIKFIGSNKKNIFPFSTPENKKSVRNILNTIQTWIQKVNFFFSLA